MLLANLLVTSRIQLADQALFLLNVVAGNDVNVVGWPLPIDAFIVPVEVIEQSGTDVSAADVYPAALVDEQAITAHLVGLDGQYVVLGKRACCLLWKRH